MSITSIIECWNWWAFNRLSETIYFLDIQAGVESHIEEIVVLGLNVGIAPLNELELKFLPIIRDNFDQELRKPHTYGGWVIENLLLPTSPHLLEYKTCN